MELQGERLELFNEIINLDTESIEKVKKYIKYPVLLKWMTLTSSLMKRLKMLCVHYLMRRR